MEPGDSLTGMEAVRREAAGTETAEQITAAAETEIVEAAMAGIAEAAETVNGEQAALEETGTGTGEQAALEEAGTETGEQAALEETGTGTGEQAALEETGTETGEQAVLEETGTGTGEQAVLAEEPEAALPVPDSGIPALRALTRRSSQSPPAAARITTITTKMIVMIKRT